MKLSIPYNYQEYQLKQLVNLNVIVCDYFILLSIVLSDANRKEH